MAKNEFRLQIQIHGQSRYGRAAVGVLHCIQRARRVDHAKSQPAEGVQGEFGNGRRGLHGVGKKKQEQLYVPGRGQSPRASDRHDCLAVGNTAHHTVRVRNIYRIVERPDSPEEAGPVVAHLWRTRADPGLVGLRVLFLRTADGSRRSGGVCAVVADRRLDDHVYGRVHVHFRRNYGLCFSVFFFYFYFSVNTTRLRIFN